MRGWVKCEIQKEGGGGGGEGMLASVVIADTSTDKVGRMGEYAPAVRCMARLASRPYLWLRSPLNEAWHKTFGYETVKPLIPWISQPLFHRC